MTLLKNGLLCAAAIIGLTATATTPPVLDDIDQFSFVNMQNDTTITASFTSAGCFYSDSGVLRFTPESVSFKDETKSLDFTQLAGLDKYLRDLFSKNNRDAFGGCTSITTLTLTLNRDGQAIGQVALRDDFCLREDGMISPDGLRYQLFEQEDTEQLSLIEE